MAQDITQEPVQGVKLADLSWPQLEDVGHEAILVVPIGSTEQHGPHLPLSTDTDIAVALADVLRRWRSDVVVAPPVAYGSSGEHADFLGTISIGQKALEMLIVELGRSASATFSRLLLLCAHGGNAAPVRRAEQRLSAEGRNVLAFFPRWGLDAHAGRAETSIMLAVAAEHVRPDLAEGGETAALSEILARLMTSGVRAVSSNGVLGDPTGASAEEGRRLLQHGLGMLVSAIDRWEDRS